MSSIACINLKACCILDEVMKRFFASFGLSLALLIGSNFSPLVAFADTYGSGNYGACDYGTGCTSTSVGSTISSAITSAGNTISAFFCSNQAPSSAPNLYEIDVTSTTATIYFSPAGRPYDNHYISYGQGNDSEGYGIDLSTSQSPGALFYKIQQLSPNTIYTFKVRGGNGCKPGPWSNRMTVQTRGRGVTAFVKFYPNHQAQYVQAKPASWIAQASVFVGDLLPKAPHTGFAPAKQHIKTQLPTTESEHTTQTSLWGKVVNFFTNALHL